MPPTHGTTGSWLRAMAALVAGSLLTAASAQTGSYSIIDIGSLAPPGEFDATNATGLNELGHVAAITGDGSGPGDFIPVLYRDGVLIDLGGLPGGSPGGGAKGVSNLDQVSGWGLHPWGTLGMQSEPFLWTEQGGMVNPLHGTPQGDWSGEAWDVNDAGQMVFTSKGGFWDPVTGFKQVKLGAGAGYTWDLNEDGVVAGSAPGPTLQLNALRYHSATNAVVNLNDPVLDHHSEGYGINDLGDVAGWAVQNDAARPAMLWTIDGQAHRIPAGDLQVDHTDGVAEHVNNHADVVGVDSVPFPTGGNPLYDQIGWVIFDYAGIGSPVKAPLRSLLSPSQAKQWRWMHPFEINDRGEITGIGVLASSQPGSGFARGFLMVPNGPDRFRNLSRALAGVAGHPVLTGRGTLVAGTTVELTLAKAAPNAPGFLMLGLGTVYAPLRGGVLVPDIFGPGGAALPTVTDGNGRQALSVTWPAGIPAGLEIVAQYWLVDAAGPHGASASNAIVQAAN